jgi:hypothetical protein
MREGFIFTGDLDETSLQLCVQIWREKKSFKTSNLCQNSEPFNSLPAAYLFIEQEKHKGKSAQLFSHAHVSAAALLQKRPAICLNRPTIWADFGPEIPPQKRPTLLHNSPRIWADFPLFSCFLQLQATSIPTPISHFLRVKYSLILQNILELVAFCM